MAAARPDALDHPAPGMGPIGLAILGVALLCAMDAVIKQLSLALPVASVVCASFWCRIPFAAAYWKARGGRPITRDMWAFHGTRGLVIALATWAFFEAIDRLPLAEAVLLAFFAPLAMPMLAWAVLGERPRRGSMLAIMLGFVGVAIAVGAPGAGGFQGERAVGAACALASAVLFALSLILLRLRAGRDGPARVNLLGAIFPALWLSPLALWLGAVPGGGEWPLIVLAGLLGAAGMVFYAAAYGRAQAQHLAPIEYTALGWAALLGWMFFDETPRAALFAGAAVVVAATLLAQRDERAARPPGLAGPTNPAA